MKQSEVKEKFLLTETLINELKEKCKKQIQYLTELKYIPKIGHITELTTIKEVVKAHKNVMCNFDNLENSSKELKLTEDEIDSEEQTYLGFTKEQWNNDFEKKLNEIRDRTKLDRLVKLRKTLKKFLSDDDKFDIEMNSVSKDLLLLDEKR